ncbi:NADH--cytochrome b5 reductase 1-like [Gossypium australe]|uniref:NADH--cytochrome b5 reductase 1-like n=1 Tax=Gossypium australe TaxID=47621 RepID=A0A5B6USV1_9ROSI|nr:NADH--cytochrome b5 reductase 1-like [Gossypium australe]
MVQESIARLAVTSNNFEIKPFRGSMTKDPNQSLKRITGSLMMLFVFDFFRFSLIDNTFSWLDSQAPRSITTWDELTGKFLQKFFPINTTVQLRREIASLDIWKGKASMKCGNASKC